ncbi:MAG: hypothetical protein Q4E36_00215 [Bacillota bacterium]|nr:hypothetical protein [Bacillota bacterium]
MIKYSLKALEDLAQLKADLMDQDPVFSLVKITSLVDQIGQIDFERLEDFKVFQASGHTYYYKIFQDQIVFLRLINGQVFIDRIFHKDLDFVTLALDL